MNKHDVKTLEELEMMAPEDLYKLHDRIAIYGSNLYEVYKINKLRVEEMNK